MSQGKINAYRSTYYQQTVSIVTFKPIIESVQASLFTHLLYFDLSISQFVVI